MMAKISEIFKFVLHFEPMDKLRCWRRCTGERKEVLSGLGPRLLVGLWSSNAFPINRAETSFILFTSTWVIVQSLRYERPTPTSVWVFSAPLRINLSSVVLKYIDVESDWKSFRDIFDEAVQGRSGGILSRKASTYLDFEDYVNVQGGCGVDEFLRMYVKKSQK